MPDTRHDGEVNAVGRTACITAAFRAVELAHSTQPIIHDPLAPHLGKAALDLATAEWRELVAHQGPGKSLRVPARNRVLDDELLAALQRLADGGVTRVQVVNVGCGMDSKPWRLRPPCQVAWLDVDQPGVLGLKQRLLAEARASTTRAAAAAPAAAAGGDAAGFPLLVASWRPVAADLAVTPLACCLRGAGFDARCPTVWLAEALLYYLPLDQACALLADMRALSAPGSKLLATCIDRELYVADHERLQAGHYFHAMWHFCVDDLVQDGQRRLRGAGFALDMQPHTTADIAAQRHGRQTYVPLYGGAECVFTADPV